MRFIYLFSPVPYTLILLLAAFFSFLALGNARRFHPDEAYYMTIARHAAVNGDWWLLAEPVDKPPLTFYMNALALVFFAVESDVNGVLQLDALKGEFAGRFPALLLSILLVAVVMKLAKTLTKSDEAAYLAGLIMALSPLRIVFAATAFTDMPMLCFAVLALLMAVRGKAGWAGVWFVLSFAAKPQVMFYLPLVLYLMVYVHGGRNPLPASPEFRGGIQRLFRFLVPVLFGVGISWLWDAGRMAQGAESFWALGQSRYTATGLTVLEGYVPRLMLLWDTIQYSFGHGVITAGALSFGLIFSRQRILSLWLLGFVVIHLILTLNLFDRNLILMLPVMAILVGDGLIQCIFGAKLTKVTGAIYCAPTESHRFKHSSSKFGVFLVQRQKAVPTVLLLVCLSGLVFFALQAAWGSLPIGGDDGRHDGIDELADYVNSKALAAVIYDPWLDWELDYYMGQWTNKRRVFYPSVELLLHDALLLDEQGSRYFIVPVWIDESLWLSGLRENGFGIHLDREFENFRVWELLPPD